MSRYYDNMVRVMLERAGILAVTSEEAKAAMSLFLEKAFENSDSELNALRRWKRDFMPVVVDWSARQDRLNGRSSTSDE